MMLTDKEVLFRCNACYAISTHETRERLGNDLWHKLTNEKDDAWRRETYKSFVDNNYRELHDNQIPYGSFWRVQHSKDLITSHNQPERSKREDSPKGSCY